MGKIMSIKTSKPEVIVRKKIDKNNTSIKIDKPTEETKSVEKPIKIIKTYKPLFPGFDLESIYTDFGRLTKRGYVYLFHRDNRDKVLGPIKINLKSILKDKSLFDNRVNAAIDKSFDDICITAMSKSDKMTMAEIRDYITKRLKEMEEIHLLNFSFLDI